MKASQAIIGCGIIILQLSSICWSSPEYSTAEPSECKLELQRVELPVEDGSSKIYTPPHLMIKRCSGCCDGAHTFCRAVFKVTNKYEVMMNDMINGTGISKLQIFLMDEDGFCECGKRPKRILSFEQKIQEKLGILHDVEEEDSSRRAGFNFQISMTENLARVTGCTLEPQTVYFRDFLTYARNERIDIRPSCTKIKKCGGYCYAQGHSCKTATNVTKSYQVEVYETNGLHVTWKKTEIISVVEDTSCECQCAVNQSNCTEKQRFYLSACGCRCTNIEEAKICNRNPLKEWDVHNCSCHCAVNLVCPELFRFNMDECRCQQTKSPYWFLSDDGHILPLSLIPTSIKIPGWRPY